MEPLVNKHLYVKQGHVALFEHFYMEYCLETDEEQTC